MRVGMVAPRLNLLDFKALEHFLGRVENDSTRFSLALVDICRQCEGLSGRALRKLPFLAYSFYIQGICTLDQFLQALKRTIDREYQGRGHLNAIKAD